MMMVVASSAPIDQFVVRHPSYFFDASPDVNFSNGDIADWNWIADPIYGTGAQFYAPIISDPVR